MSINGTNGTNCFRYKSSSPGYVYASVLGAEVPWRNQQRFAEIDGGGRWTIIGKHPKSVRRDSTVSRRIMVVDIPFEDVDRFEAGCERLLKLLAPAKSRDECMDCQPVRSDPLLMPTQAVGT